MKRWEDVYAKEQEENRKKARKKKRIKTIVAVVAVVTVLSSFSPTTITAQATEYQGQEEKPALVRIIDATIGQVFGFSKVFEGAK